MLNHYRHPQHISSVVIFVFFSFFFSLFFFFCSSFFFFFVLLFFFFFFQAEDGIRDLVRSRGLGDVYKRQELCWTLILVPIRS